MTHTTTEVKRTRYWPKDWVRRSKVQSALYERQMTIEDLRKSLDVNQGYLSSIIWGTQRSTKWEKLIAIELGKSWEELFAATTVIDMGVAA